MPINVFRQSRCLNTSDSICDLFKWVCDRNDRNDKGNGKSYVRANDRGLWISCHSCHLCHLKFCQGSEVMITTPIFIVAVWRGPRVVFFDSCVPPEGQPYCQNTTISLELAIYLLSR